jgi:hypothetical protein
MARSDRLSHGAQLLVDCEDALFRLAMARLEARRAAQTFEEANAGDADLTPEAMDRAFAQAWPRIRRRTRQAGKGGGEAVRRRASARVGMVAAALLTVAIIGGISALAASPAMRRSLSRLLVDPQREFTDFRMEQEFRAPEVPAGYEGDFFPSYIPPEFVFEQTHRGSALYVAEDGRTFAYHECDEHTTMGFDTEDAQVDYGKVGGTDAMLVRKGGRASVIWSFANRFFLVTLEGSPEEAMKVAESLVVIQ